MQCISEFSQDYINIEPQLHTCLTSGKNINIICYKHKYLYLTSDQAVPMPLGLLLLNIGPLG